MPTNDDPKLRVSSTMESDASRAEPVGEPGPQLGPPPAPTLKPRGAYRISDEAMRKDPQVEAFLSALRRIADPRKREGLEWLVHELARTKRRGR